MGKASSAYKKGILWMKKEIKVFEGHEVKVFELNGQVLFNPYHVGECLDMASGTVKDHMAKMNNKQVIKVKNSDVGLTNFRKLNNAGENFLSESDVYKLVFKSRKTNAEAFTDWVTDEVLPTIRKTGSYTLEEVDRLPAINKAAETILPVLEELGMKPIHKAYMLKQLYRQAGVEIPIEGQEEDQHLYDSTQIAKKLGICSVKGLPHSQAVGAILKKLQLAEDEKVITSFERKGHVGTMCQYKESVVNAVARWLLENGHPETISYQDGKGREKTCTVIYQNIA